MMLCEYSSYTGHHKRTMAFSCHYTSLEKRVCKSACLYVRPSVRLLRFGVPITYPQLLLYHRMKFNETFTDSLLPNAIVTSYLTF